MSRRAPEILVPSWSPLQGVQRWRTEAGFTVLQVHYSADPDKDLDWAEEAAKRLGGMSSKGWRAEMEIEWDARSGGRVYDEFTEATHVLPHWGEAVQKETEVWPMFVGIDPGFNNPTAVVWMRLNGEGEFYIVDEYYRRKKTVAEICREIKFRNGRNKVEFYVIDPSAFQRTQVGAGKSIADQFAENGIACNPGNNAVEDGIDCVAGLLHVKGNGEPSLKVLDHCRHTITEFKNYRYEELTDLTAERRDPKERPLKKGDHLMDAIRYVAMSVPQDYMRRYLMQDPMAALERAVTIQQASRAQVRTERVRQRMEDWDSD